MGKVVENKINCCHSSSHPYLRPLSAEMPKKDINKVYYAAATATKLKSIIHGKQLKRHTYQQICIFKLLTGVYK